MKHITPPMDESSSKLHILQRIREALQEKTPNPYPNIENNSFLGVSQEEYPEIVFAKKIQEWGGKFIYCANRQEFLCCIIRIAVERKLGTLYTPDQSLINNLNNMGFHNVALGKPDIDGYAAICFCDGLVAESGSIFLSDEVPFGHIYAGTAGCLFIIATTSQVSNTLTDALQAFEQASGYFPKSSVLINNQVSVYSPDFSLQQPSIPHHVFVMMIEDKD